MSQINLLRQQTQTPGLGGGSKILRAMISVVALLLAAEIVAGLGLFVAQKRSTSKVISVEKKKNEVTARFSDYENRRQKAVALQKRLITIPALFEERKSARSLLEEIARVTPRTVRYSTFRLDEKGKIFVSGTVRTYKETGELLLALRSSPHIESVILRNVGPSTKDIAGVQFDIHLIVLPSIFEFAKE